MPRLAPVWAFVLLFIATSASSHLIVDVRMSIAAPAFVRVGESFTYHVVAEDLAYDPAYGVVVTIDLTSGTIIGNLTAKGWNCSRSVVTITCSAEQIKPGPNAIDVAVVAPTHPVAMEALAEVKTLGSVDPIRDNDSALAMTAVYDPAACQTAPPLLEVPADTASVGGTPRLAWSAVSGVRQYFVHTKVEGAFPSVVAMTSNTNVVIVAEPGTTEWWVEADFGTCPPVTSPNRTFSALQVSRGSLSIYAGRTDTAETRDGPLATATFREPYGLTFSSDQRQLFVTDQRDSVLRRIMNGAIVTLNGTPGVEGSTDGTAPQFRNPRGIAVTALDGFIYIADTGNDEIRFAIAGNTVSPAFAVAGAAQIPGYVDDVSDKSRLNSPSGVATSERGLVFAADTQNHVIRKLTPVPVSGVSGLFNVSTIGGIGGQPGSADGVSNTAQFRAPEGIAADRTGVVYVADTGNHTIRKIDGGMVSTVAGEAGIASSNDGRGASAHFDSPSALTLDDRGNLYVCDRGNHAIRRIAPSGLVTTVATGLQTPSGIAIDNAGNIYVADSAAHVIRMIVPAVASLPTRHRSVSH